jgi:pyridoxal phosphate enzyme (YggS family)
MTDPSNTIAQTRADILKRLAAAAKQAARPAHEIDLVAVSKKQPDERIEAMLAAGQRVFGENRVQEAQTRWQVRRRAYSDLELRLIGPLQTNKVDDAVALFDVIESLDREKLAKALRKSIDRLDKSPRLYVQVNTGDEPQKAGVSVSDLPQFLSLCQNEYGFEIEGLMCIPPVEEPASLHFALLKKLADRHGLAKCSMGMSADFELAARLGATSVRVGSALFGERPTA